MFTSAISGKEENPYKNIIDDVVETCDNFYAMILNKNLMKVMIDNVSLLYPEVVDDIIPSKISCLQLKQELTRLVEERKAIRNFIGILEDMEKNL